MEPMEYVRLGSTGLKVSRLCFGTMTYGAKQWREWVLEEEESKPFYRSALDYGFNFFDTADMYSLGRSEEITGKMLFREFGVRRQDVVIATKVFNPMSDRPNDRGLSRKHIMESIDASLKRLGTDYVDLYQIHRFDRETPIDETVTALHDVVKAGKALYIGASAMYAWQFMKMLARQEQLGLTRFVSMQNHYNIVYREEEREMLPLCRAEGIGVIPFSALARGFVAGNRRTDDWGETVRSKTDVLARPYYGPHDFALVDRISEVAKERGVSNVQIALAWLLQQPGVTSPILGVSKPGQLDGLMPALDLKLDESELKRLNELYQPHRIIGHS